MARYYTTADRQFNDDYIYKPPIEIANQMIDRAQSNVDKVSSEANADLAKIYDQIPYYRDTDEQDYRNLVNAIENEYNSVMNLAKENPFKDYSAQIAQAKANVARMMQQGGQYWNVTENARRYDNQVRMAKSVIKDQNLLNKTLDYIKDEYRQGRTNKYDDIIPLTQDNLFGTEPSFAYSQGMDLETEFGKLVKNQKGTQYVNGQLTTKEVTDKDVEEVKDAFRKSIENGGYSSVRTYMEHADRVGLNGDEKWLNKDGSINTKGSLWKNLGGVATEEFTYKHTSKRSSSSGNGTGAKLTSTGTRTDIPTPDASLIPAGAEWKPLLNSGDTKAIHQQINNNVGIYTVASNSHIGDSRLDQKDKVVLKNGDTLTKRDMIKLGFDDSFIEHFYNENGDLVSSDPPKAKIKPKSYSNYFVYTENGNEYIVGYSEDCTLSVTAPGNAMFKDSKPITKEVGVISYKKYKN